MIARTSTRVRRDPRDTAAFATDPEQVLPLITGFGRFLQHGPDEWDVFLDVGTLHVGGRVEVSRDSWDRLTWQSLRGTRHRFELTVAADEETGSGSRLNLLLDFELSGLVLSRVAELLARGIAVRHMQAAAEEIRHHVEHELRLD